MRGPKRKTIVARFAGCLFLLALGAVLGGEAAQAQLTCEPIVISVSTAAEFDAAIDCHNQVGDIGIELLNDIEAATLASDSVFAAIYGAGDLIIDGGGFTLRRGDTAANTPAPVVALITDPLGDEFAPATRLILIDLGIEIGPHDTAGIAHESPHRLSLRSVSIIGDTLDPTATGIVSTAAGDGEIYISGSFFDLVETGIELGTQTYFIDSSTINSAGVDIKFAGSGGNGGIYNSTLGGPVGIEFGQGLVSVENSTILGDAALAGPTAGQNSVVTFTSSIANLCTAAEIVGDTQPGPGWVNLGNNAGGCFGGASFVVDTFLDDNGCARPTPAGCPLTASINGASAAFGIGICDAVSVDLNNRDQRGQLRTPAGLGCDAGSYEAGCDQSGGVFAVATERSFQAAIECLNLHRDSSAWVLVDLQNDVEAQAVSSDSVFTQITQPTAADLTIEGNGFALRRGTSAPATAAPLLATGPSSAVRVEIRDLVIEVGQHDTHGMSLLGESSLDMQHSAVVATSGGSSATGLLLDQGGDSLVAESVIDGMAVGVQAKREFVGIHATTITSSQTDVLSDGSTFVSIANSTLTAPTGFGVGTGIHYLVYSTVLGDGAATRVGSTGSVNTISSIVNSCSAPLGDMALPGPVVIDRGGNVGGCFNPGQTIDTALADNGCTRPTPVGCPQTIALGQNSVALTAGNCSETEGGLVSTDQRGAPRTPVGPGCDSGAHEADCAGTHFDVGTVPALNAAIGCFNSPTALAANYTFTLTDDLLMNGVGDNDARTVSINQPRAGFSLDIDGAGFRMFEPEPLGIGNGPPATFAFLAMNETNQAAVRFTDIVLETERDPDASYLIWNKSSATLSIQRSRLYILGDRTIQSDGGGDLFIEDSSLSAGFGGVQITGGDLIATRSTFTDLSLSGLSVIVAGPSRITVTNSTFVAGGILADAATDGTVMNSTFGEGEILGGAPTDGTVMNSTVANYGVAGLGEVTVGSSIVNACGTAVIPGGNNVGECFGIPVDLGDAADNGCTTPTPTGCPFTFALAPDSPALGAGDCSSTPTDQRGVSRTPAGVGCDAGAFERAALAPGDVTNNGVTDNADVQALLLWLAGGPEPVALSAGDVTGDGLVKLNDALAIAQLVTDPG